MAKLPLETTTTINNLKQQLLDIVNDAKTVEFTILNTYGETELSIIVLDELKNVSEEVASRYFQLSNLQLRIAEDQPIIAPDMLRFLADTIIKTQTRIPAFLRSIEEIKIDWNLL